MHALIKVIYIWSVCIQLAFSSKIYPNTTNNVEYITSREFIYRVCDYTYGTRTAHNALSVEASGKCNPSEILPANSIICVRGDERVIDGFMTEGSCFQKAPFTLVTLETDDSSPAKPSWVKTKNLIKWYGWNAYANSGVIPIPIGLNSDSMLNPIRHAQITHWDEKKHQVLLAFKAHTPERLRLNRIAIGLNFTVKWPYKPTYRSHSTQLDMYEAMSKFKCVFSCSLSDIVLKLRLLVSLTYISNSFRHRRFVACPAGTGVDTHRFWEALYMESVPIVLRGQLSSLYENVPVIQLNSWSELTQSLIDSYVPKWKFSLVKDYPFQGNISESQLQLFRKSWNNSVAFLDTWITRIRGEAIKSVLLPV